MDRAPREVSDSHLSDARGEGLIVESQKPIGQKAIGNCRWHDAESQLHCFFEIADDQRTSTQEYRRRMRNAAKQENGDGLRAVAEAENDGRAG